MVCGDKVVAGAISRYTKPAPVEPPIEAEAEQEKPEEKKRGKKRNAD